MIAPETLELALRQASKFATSRRMAVPGDFGGLLWPLFIQESPSDNVPYEIDTCATALGFLASRWSDVASSDAELASKSIATLVEMRQPDGSWPSIRVYPGRLSYHSMEGVTNDTIFALEALTRGGFLAPDEMVSGLAFSDSRQYFRSSTNRLKWLEHTVDWIEDNRVGSGWYYTSTSHMAHPEQYRPTVGPTASMVLVLDTAIRALEGRGVEYYLRLVSMRDAAVAWLVGAQNADGGFGRDDRSTSLPGHTGLALLALLIGQGPKPSSAAASCVDWLVNWCLGSECNVNDVDCFDEYQQMLLESESAFSKRLIAHEYPVEPICLRALCGFLDVSPHLPSGLVSRVSRSVQRLARATLSRQVSSGPLRGSFVSRRASAGEKAPIYWVYHAKLGLESVLSAQRSGRIRTVRFGLLISITVITIVAILFLIWMGWLTWVTAIVTITLGVLVNLVTYAATK